MMISFQHLGELEIVYGLAIFMIVMGVISFVALQFQTATYGRYYSSQKKDILNACPMNGKLAWFLQEIPSFLLPILVVYFSGIHSIGIANAILLAMYLSHYVYRALIFPFLINGGKPTPFLVFLLAFVFCIYNGSMQGLWLVRHARYSEDWIHHPQFIVGCSLWLIGLCTHIHADHVLRNLRKPGETGYKIPYGGAFNLVSGANFFGEIVEWFGFALASNSLVGAAFSIFTFCNIGPRAHHHHQYYLSKFENYPKQRKALIPFFW